MSDFLSTAVTGHMAWRSRLLTAIKERRTPDAKVARSDCDCALGKWLYGEGKHQHSQRPQYRRLFECHAEFHRQAGQVVDLIAANRMAEAKASILSGPFHSQSIVTVEAIDDLRSALAGKPPSRPSRLSNVSLPTKTRLVALLTVGSAVSVCVAFYFAVVGAGLTPAHTQTLVNWIVVLAAVLIAGQAFGSWWMQAKVIRPFSLLASKIVQLERGEDDVEIPVLKRRDAIGELAEAAQSYKAGMIEKSRADEDSRAMRRQVDDAHEQNERDQLEAIRRERALVAESIGEGLARLAAKDLTYRIDRELPEAYAKLRSDFNLAIAEYEDAMRVVAKSTHSIFSGARELASAAGDLSQRTESQAASLEQTSAALHQVTTTVERSAEGAAHARRVASLADDEARKGAQVMRDAVGAMNGIAKSADEIGKIIGVIDEIAFQTNLLALNAGVEAARAGEAGRGFAVVASEVRGLALRSAEAAKEIKGLISASGAQVSKGVELVGLTGKSLELIGARVAEINDAVASIAGGAKEQAIALAEVNSAITEMDKTTQQNATMVEESTAATTALASESTQLSQAVGQFRLGGEAQAAAPRRRAA